MKLIRTEVELSCDECQKTFSFDHGVIVVLKDKNSLFLCNECTLHLQSQISSMCFEKNMQ